MMHSGWRNTIREGGDFRYGGWHLYQERTRYDTQSKILYPSARVYSTIQCCILGHNVVPDTGDWDWDWDWDCGLLAPAVLLLVVDDILRSWSTTLLRS